MFGRFVVALALMLPAGRAVPASAQALRVPEDTVSHSAADSADARGGARAAQASFERRRMRLLPLARGSYTGSCDENVGRFCTWYDEDGWWPGPEDPRITSLRDELIVQLDAAAEVIPGDDWILGQRVWYRGEAGRWAEALALAEACGGASPWWCAALSGLALHAQERFHEAAGAFERALRLMDPERARRWRVPRWPVEGAVRDALEDLSGPELERALRRLWLLADPLFIVPGNDRMTAHYARWTVGTLKRGTRTPFAIPWGDDLLQLTVRNGWEIGWERMWGRDLTSADAVVGHKHPEGRDFMPPARAFRHPSASRAEDLVAGTRRPRSLYAPPYAPQVLPFRGQVALFPRGARTVVVATHFLPEDTTWAARHGLPRPWLDPPDGEGREDRGGLFLVPLGTGDSAHIASATSRGSTEGRELVDVPAGRYLVSVEAWSPRRRRAGRYRRGLEAAPVPPDVPRVSDLLLLRPGPTGENGAGLEATLRGSLDDALLRAEVSEGSMVDVAFEITGATRRGARFDLELEVQRANEGLLRRLGRALRLVGGAPRVAVAWTEVVPGGVRPLFKRVRLDLRGLEPGPYRMTLSLTGQGREATVARLDMAIVSPGRGAR